MKFIKRSKLAFTEGNSDKVYEVDLCELINDSEQRFLVNFRYGRRGATLREGTKTPTPVDLSSAEDIFNSLVVSKTNKGYVSVGNAQAKAPRAPGPAVDIATLLNQIDEQPDTELRARAIWRLPQAPNAIVAERLAQGLNADSWLENYSRLWVIGHTGNRTQVSAVRPFVESSNDKLSALAVEVLMRLDESEASRIVAQVSGSLPHDMATAINGGNEQQIAEILRLNLGDKKRDNNALLKSLYIIASASTPLYRTLLAVVQSIAIGPGVFKGLRYLFKMAEFRFDAAMFAALCYRFETTKHFFVSDYWYWNRSGKSGLTRLQNEAAKSNCSVAYSDKTRTYLRRRGWRTLRRLGVRDDDRYADMAASALLAFSNADKQPERRVQRYQWESGKTVTVEYDGYARYLILNEILHSNGDDFARSANRLSWIKVGSAPGDRRGEAFVHIWDRRPELLLEVLIGARADIVGEFAARALSDNVSFCDAISDEHIYRLLLSPLSSAVEFAATLLQRRKISDALLALLFKSGNERARDIALEALARIADPFAAADLLTELLLIEDARLVGWLEQRWQSHTFSYSDGGLVERVADALLRPDAALSETHAAWLSELLIQHLQSAVYDLALEKISALIHIDNAGVQLFAASLLTANRISFRDIPQAVLERINNSDSAAVRAVGIALFNKTSEFELLNQLPLLTELIYHGEREERDACLCLLEKLLPAYAQRVFDLLLPMVFKEERQEGQQEALFQFISNRLAAEQAALDKDTVWRLTHASSAAAQRLGASILEQYDMSAFTVKQWVALANNPNQNVRQRARDTFELSLGVVKNNSRDALRILESHWPDSREFAFGFFQRHYQESDWSVELIIGVCDSNLPDVQAYGRELIQTFFKREQGEEYLQKLSQHPSMQVQAFVANLLHDYAAGRPEVILSLQHYFTSVLSQINRGRVSKDCVLAFLIKEANASAAVLETVAALFTRLSLTLVHKDKSQLIKAMLELKKQHPDLTLPIRTKPVRAVNAVQGENHAG